MANPSKRKGTQFETDVVRYLADHGFPFAERRALCGTSDKGDVSGIPGVVLEAKAEKSIDLAGYMDEVKVETANAHASIGVAVVKRRNRPVGVAYVVMTLEQFAAMISDEVTP